MILLIKKLITKRSILGTLFLMIFIGETTVGQNTGLYTIRGFILFFLLYLSLYHLYEALITKYHLVVFQIILLTFALYSVLVTGLLNKELTEYILKPNLFITPIRIQASFFVVFAFYLLNKVLPRNEVAITLKQSIWFFIFVVLLVSTSGVWGLPAALFTFKTVPLIALIFILLGFLALYIAFKTHPQPTSYTGKVFIILTIFYFVLGIIPSLEIFTILLFSMILGGVYILLNKDLRNLPL